MVRSEGVQLPRELERVLAAEAMGARFTEAALGSCALRTNRRLAQDLRALTDAQAVEYVRRLALALEGEGDAPW